MSVLTLENKYPGFQLLRPATEHILHKVIKEEAVSFTHVNIIVTDDNTLNRLKKQYFNDDVLTDTISFNFNDPGQDIDGEIYISIDRIRANARKYNNPFQQELALVIIHSLLHLIGYEDQNPGDKQIMDRRQQRYLQQLSIKRLYRTQKSHREKL